MPTIGSALIDEEESGKACEEYVSHTRRKPLRVFFFITASNKVQKSVFFHCKHAHRSRSLVGIQVVYSCTFQAQRYARSTVIKPGQALSIIPQSDLVITNAALGAELADHSGRTSVKLTYMRPVKVTDDDEDDEEKDEDDDEDVQVETVLCSLTPGTVSNAIS